jgi:hypothetical protein
MTSSQPSRAAKEGIGKISARFKTSLCSCYAACLGPGLVLDWH